MPDDVLDLRAAAHEVVTRLRPFRDDDWGGRTAADSDWTCEYVAQHISDVLYFYACQLLYARPEEGAYLPTELTLDAHRTPTLLLDAIEVHAELLHVVLGHIGADVRAWHIWGMTDRTGFAAMAVFETLVHGYDLVHAFEPDAAWRPPSELAAPVVERLFPDAPDGPATDVLLWCGGRTELANRPRRTEWRWDARVRG